MPWTDQSKPAGKPGPWDPPEGGEGGAAEGGRGAPTPPKIAASPWDAPEPAKRSREPRPRPGGPPPPPSPPRGPRLDDLGRQLRLGMRRAALAPFGRGLRLRLLGVAAAAVFGAWLASGVYTVGPDEAGLVSRFGALVAVASPGLHYRLPAPFEAVRLVPVGAPERLEIAPPTDGGDGGLHLLTRDGDPVALGFAVDWRVSDPVRFAFHLAAPTATLAQAAQSAVASAVAETSAADLAAGRDEVGAHAAAALQRTLDAYGAGVDVTRVTIEGVTPPADAAAAFKDLAAASEAARADEAEAASYRARVLADARGEAAKTLLAAEAERDEEISVAKGEAARFTAIDTAYRKAPATTRERLYTETMARVLHDTPKVVVQTSRAGSTQVVLPPELFRPKTPPAPAAAAEQPAPAPAQSSGGASATGPAT